MDRPAIQARQQLETYELYQRQIANCDREVKKVLEQMDGKADPGKKLATRKGPRIAWAPPRLSTLPEQLVGHTNWRG